jgi:uncharacterized membrane protein YkvA (DUF1232 family)
LEEEMTLKERARQLKSDIPAVWLAIGRKDTPWYAKAVGGLALVYALSPIDLIPDFIPVLGMLDDLIVLPLLITLFLKWIPKTVLAECRELVAAQAFASPRKRWVYAIPFLIVWLVVFVWVISLIVTRA